MLCIQCSIVDFVLQSKVDGEGEIFRTTVSAFWQVFHQELQVAEPDTPLSVVSSFHAPQPREKWLKRRTTIKLKASER